MTETGVVNVDLERLLTEHPEVLANFIISHESVAHTALTTVREHEPEIYNRVAPSYVDSQTNLLTKLGLCTVLDRSIEISAETNEPLSIVFLDMDNFKKCNDKYGHQFGDIVLAHLSYLLTSNKRTKPGRNQDYITSNGSYTAARWGSGDEMVCVLPGTNEEGAFTFSKRLGEKMRSHVFDYNGARLNFSISAGISEYLKGDTKESLLCKADMAMYVAKRNRGSAVKFSQLVVSYSQSHLLLESYRQERAKSAIQEMTKTQKTETTVIGACVL